MTQPGKFDVLLGSSGIRKPHIIVQIVLGLAGIALQITAYLHASFFMALAGGMLIGSCLAMPFWKVWK